MDAPLCTDMEFFTSGTCPANFPCPASPCPKDFWPYPSLPHKKNVPVHPWYPVTHPAHFTSLCHFFSTNVLFGLNFSPHESVKIVANSPKIVKIFQNFPKFPKISSKFPKFSPHDNFFSATINCDICDKYELCHHYRYVLYSQ